MGRALVTGGAGFIGSHLIDVLLERGDEAVAVDDFSTGRRSNLAHLVDHPGFTLVEADVVEGLPVDGAFSLVMHLASPASPPEFIARPFDTLDVGSVGTRHALDLAHENGARFVLASTSEIYGDPVEHPQSESYRGNVDPVGPRSVYDEAKRFAESLTAAYRRELGVNTAIARIFNTYGPRLEPSDGRVISNFCVQALTGCALTVYGDGSQTRSYCYVSDQVRGLVALADSELGAPVNIGNPNELTVTELAKTVIRLARSDSEIVHKALPVDDPARRCPDISLVCAEVGWEPVVSLEEGLQLTLDWYRAEIADG